MHDNGTEYIPMLYQATVHRTGRSSIGHGTSNVGRVVPCRSVPSLRARFRRVGALRASPTTRRVQRLGEPASRRGDGGRAAEGTANGRDHPWDRGGRLTRASCAAERGCGRTVGRKRDATRAQPPTSMAKSHQASHAGPVDGIHILNERWRDLRAACISHARIARPPRAAVCSDAALCVRFRSRFRFRFRFSPVGRWRGQTIEPRGTDQRERSHPVTLLERHGRLPASWRRFPPAQERRERAMCSMKSQACG